MANLSKGFVGDYDIRLKNNGVYVFVIEGVVIVNDQSLNKRDGFGVWDTTKITISATCDAQILLIDVPMD